MQKSWSYLLMRITAHARFCACALQERLRSQRRVLRVCPSVRGFGNLLHRASAPAILVSSGQASSALKPVANYCRACHAALKWASMHQVRLRNRGRPKKSVAFGLRYSIVIGGENFSEGRRVSEVEAQKKAHATQQWWAERRRLGYDTYMGEGRASASPSPTRASSVELPVRRPRSTSRVAMELPECDADADSVLPVGRQRSRTNFSADDVQGQCDLEDSSHCILWIQGHVLEDARGR